MDFVPRDSTDPRERDDESIYGSRWGEDVRERDGGDRELDPRDRDPRDPFVPSVDLPRGLECELASRVRAGFTCVVTEGRGGAPFSPRDWDWP